MTVTATGVRSERPAPVVTIGMYTAACRSCGRRLNLTDDELIASLTDPPICWPCDTAHTSGAG